MSQRAISRERHEWDLEPDEAALAMTGNIANTSEREKHIKDLISKGSVLSMLNLAHMYEHRYAEDGGPDLDLAETWYRAAVEKGSAVATLKAGYFYLRKKEYVKAREMFSIGAQREYAPSVLRLAHLYANGLGVEKDDSKTEELLLRAAKLGNLWAKISRAERYMNTDGNYLKVAKGLCLICIAGVQFRFERKFRPWSEKLKK
jgi:TPR repeat protein